MGERKVWTPEEDAALKKILEDGSVKKWSNVSRKMQEQFHIYGRTGKQCRERQQLAQQFRWHNQLNPNINNKPWTEEEENRLFLNHDLYGNKWSKIAQGLFGRTDNAIKNHFYSTLRKSVRRLNRFVAETKNKGEMKEIKPLVLSKIVVLSGDKTPAKSPLAQQNTAKSVDLKHRLIEFAKLCDDEKVDAEQMRKLVVDITNFNTSYKRRTYPSRLEKKEREQSAEATEKQFTAKREPLIINKPERPSKTPKIEDFATETSSLAQALAASTPTPMISLIPPVSGIGSSSAFTLMEKPKRREQEPVLVVEPVIPQHPQPNYQRILSSSLEAFMNGRSNNSDVSYIKLNENELNLPFLQLNTPPAHSDNPFTFSSATRPNQGDWPVDLEKLSSTLK